MCDLPKLTSRVVIDLRFVQLEKIIQGAHRDPEPTNKSNTIVRASKPETLSMELTDLKPKESLREGRSSRDRRKPAYLKDYITN